jgi:hypothetical protein
MSFSPIDAGGVSPVELKRRLDADRRGEPYLVPCGLGTAGLMHGTSTALTSRKALDRGGDDVVATVQLIGRGREAESRLTFASTYTSG